jgi:hypothetical protein
MARHSWKLVGMDDEGDGLWECEGCLTRAPGAFDGRPPMEVGGELESEVIPDEDCDRQAVRNIMRR